MLLYVCMFFAAQTRQHERERSICSCLYVCILPLKRDGTKEKAVLLLYVDLSPLNFRNWCAAGTFAQRNFNPAALRQQLQVPSRTKHRKLQYCQVSNPKPLPADPEGRRPPKASFSGSVVWNDPASCWGSPSPKDCPVRLYVSF